MDRAFKRLMKTTISWEKFKSQDGAGDITYDTASSILGRVNRTSRLVLNIDGEQVLSTITVYLDADEVADMSLKDRLTIPNCKVLPITSLSIVDGEDGQPDHLEVYL